MKMGFRWTQPPSGLVAALADYERRVLVAVRAVAQYAGQLMQDQARLTAPWQDRTGNARSGLFYAVDGLGLPPVVGLYSAGGAQETDPVRISGGKDKLVIAMGHTVYYGKFLELAHGGRYAVVMSTIERNLPVLEKMLEDLFK